ncbi:hypothetical protein Tco_1576150 [Tanacetum coccineum]
MQAQLDEKPYADFVSLPVLGTVYDSLDECIEVYRKYASEAGFGIRLSCQKRLKCGYVKQKYIVYNREGCLKEVWLNTLDAKKNDRQPERKFDLHEQTVYYKGSIMTNIGAVKLIIYSNAQMLITRMEQRQEFTKDFSLDYFVEDAELYGLFWTDEVAKCNYKEFGDIVSFDATYKTNKHKMVFVPFTTIDNHRRSGWLLRAFKKAFVRPPNIVVTDQDGAMRLAVAAEFPESKHRLFMWHIMQNIPAKILNFSKTSSLDSTNTTQV